MLPAARVQAAIEVLDLVIAAARAGGAPADRIVSDWFKPRRFAGSGDRRAVRDLVFRAIRACGDIPASGRAALLRLVEEDPALGELFDGSHHGPAVIEQSEVAARGGVAPDWLETRLALSGVAGGAAQALLGRAPLDVRINTLRAGTLDAWPVPPETVAAHHGLRFPSGTPVETWPQYQSGQIEVQDAGSQLTCEAVQARPGERVVDLCAGAGGKALALAAAMDNRGEILACDIDRTRLSRLEPRAHRAGASIITTRLLDPGKEAAMLADWQGAADAVLVDAPCTGTGTWRRNPEARWRLTPAALARVCDTQARLLDIAAGLVRPGGRLVFVTCSLLDEEGADQAAQFLNDHPAWRPQVPDLAAGEPRGQGWRLSPQGDGTDGFFIARFVSP